MGGSDILYSNKKVRRKNIWHEVDHLIEADDHYDENIKSKGKCNLDNCIMRYGNLDGELCEESINEINTWLKKNKCKIASIFKSTVDLSMIYRVKRGYLYA